jgi:hypothetical protein
MEIQLIHGEFSSNEALELLTQMIHVKIKYHESKIMIDSTEEDMKYRESKIKNLQNQLFELKDTLYKSKNGNVVVDAMIKIN